MIIGVTGHRLLKETNKLTRGVDEALIKIVKVFGTPLIIYSALSEGADRLVVYRAQAMRADTQLVAVMPMKLEDYMEDFRSLSSKAELVNFLESAIHIIELENPCSRTKAYFEAGKKILEYSDVLIAIWDGQESQGEGGTAEIVAIAREYGIPIAWVHAGNRVPGTYQSISLGEEQGLVTFEGFDLNGETSNDPGNH